MTTLAVLPRVSALLGNELEGVAPVHAEPATGVASFHPCELRRMPDFHPDMLGGVPGAEGCSVRQRRISCLVVFGNVPVGERGVLVAVPGVERLVVRQMLLGHSGVVVDVPTLDVGVIGCVPLSSGDSGWWVFLRHGDHLASRDDVTYDGTPPDGSGGLRPDHTRFQDTLQVE